MEITTRDRIEKGLDKNGLIGKWDELNENTNYVRGLILIEAKKDWESKPSNGEWKDYLSEFLEGGKPIGVTYAGYLMRHSKEQAALRKLKAMGKVDFADPLKETEAELTLPDSPTVAMELRGDNAIQKARNYKEIQETLEKDKPSGHEIRAFNKAKREAGEQQKEEREKLEKGTKVKLIKKPDPFTFEEEIDFETWCVQEKDFDVIVNKPKNVRAIYALKDENVSNLFSRLDEWKAAYKIMAKLCHPDTGGNSLAMSFLGDFKGLMVSLRGIKEVIDYEKKVEELREEYSAPRREVIELG